MSKWIPVAERLPKSGERVIVARTKVKDQPLFVEQGALMVNGWWKVYGTNTKAVTHWMPLPEPPEVDA